MRLGYYIGAGASANSLPVVKDMPCLLRELANKIVTCAERDNLNGRMEEIVGDLRWLADSSEGFTSVDALARYCHFRADTEQMTRLKKTLVAFFLLEQARRSVDPRYRDFLSYLGQLDERQNVAMPTDVRVISWNYDMQFEKAYAEFLPPDAYSKVATALQVVPGLGDGGYCSKCFSIVKLNGTASMELSSEHVLSRRYTLLISDFDDTLKQLVSRYGEDIAHYVNFAWEDDEFRSDALERVERVETLVVIGYSFPLVNRAVDQDVLTYRLRPEKLYVQAGANGPAVKERLVGLGVDAEAVSVVEDVDQFYIPDRYSPSEWRLPPHFNVPLGQ